MLGIILGLAVELTVRESNQSEKTGVSYVFVEKIRLFGDSICLVDASGIGVVINLLVGGVGKLGVIDTTAPYVVFGISLVLVFVFGDWEEEDIDEDVVEIELDVVLVVVANVLSPYDVIPNSFLRQSKT